MGEIEAINVRDYIDRAARGSVETRDVVDLCQAIELYRTRLTERDARVAALEGAVQSAAKMLATVSDAYQTGSEGDLRFAVMGADAMARRLQETLDALATDPAPAPGDGGQT